MKRKCEGNGGKREEEGKESEEGERERLVNG